VRVLFSTTAGSGHFGPLVPFARACRAAGHDVVVAAPASFAPAVAGAGFEHVPFADVPPSVMGPIFGRLPELPFEEANRVVMVEVFARLDAQAALPGVQQVIQTWRPDVVVREPCEFASMVAAERAGLPQVQIAIGMGDLVGAVAATLEPPLAELGALAGLAEGRAPALAASTATFTSVPASLDAPHAEELRPDAGARDGDLRTGRDAPVWRFRTASGAAAGGALPAPWGDADLPLVYVSFGSVTATLGPFATVYRASLEALAAMPVRVLMTTGDGLDPASLGAVPANARVERWWPQQDVMAHSAAVVGHGGFGTTMAALEAGVPQVVLPLFAVDQAIHAARVAAAGAGVHVDGGPAGAGSLAPAVEGVLTRPEFRERAEAVAAEMATLPGVAGSVEVLEGLAAR